LIDRYFGLLPSKAQELIGNKMWDVGIYVLIVLGGVALLK
jgi:hypothetical protein